MPPLRRSVEPEWLDHLPAADPRATRSRRDLLRLNRWMGNAPRFAAIFRSLIPAPRSTDVVDLGAGDGRFLLNVARRLAPGWTASARLVDRQLVVSAETRNEFGRMGWPITPIVMDVFDWLRGEANQEIRAAKPVVMANLFLHHLTERQLVDVFAEISCLAGLLVACEPRRSRLALTFSRLVGLLGCNTVTRHDAIASVRAGYAGRELSALWPDPGGWALTEQRAGWFTHQFVARRHAGR